MVQTLETMAGDGEIQRGVLAGVGDSVTGSTAIMFAAIENKINLMERMLALGCDVNTKNKEGYIALHFGKPEQ